MMIASALFVFAVALELFLFLGKDALLKTRRRDALEASLRQTYADLKEARQRIEARRAARAPTSGRPNQSTARKEPHVPSSAGSRTRNSDSPRSLNPDAMPQSRSGGFRWASDQRK